MNPNDIRTQLQDNLIAAAGALLDYMGADGVEVEIPTDNPTHYIRIGRIGEKTHDAG